MVSAPSRRLQVAFARKRGLSVRRACALLKTPRSGLAYAAKRPQKDAPATAKMLELSRRYPRYGYRRIRVFLARAGLKMSASPGARSVAASIASADPR